MRMREVLGATFVVAATWVAGQTASGIHLVDVRFAGDTRLKNVDLKKCAADLKSREYEGPEWPRDLAHRVRVLCLQDNGYYRATVRQSTKQLPDRQRTHQFVITFDIDAGPQYLTGEITFRNNHVLSSGELRSMFKLASGEVFSPGKIRQGLEQMSNAYRERRYLNFTAVPDANIDDSRGVVSMVIDCDEGQQAH